MSNRTIASMVLRSSSARKQRCPLRISHRQTASELRARQFFGLSSNIAEIQILDRSLVVTPIRSGREPLRRLDWSATIELVGRNNLGICRFRLIGLSMHRHAGQCACQEKNLDDSKNLLHVDDFTLIDIPLNGPIGCLIIDCKPTPAVITPVTH